MQRHIQIIPFTFIYIYIILTPNTNCEPIYGIIRDFALNFQFVRKDHNTFFYFEKERLTLMELDTFKDIYVLEKPNFIATTGTQIIYLEDKNEFLMHGGFNSSYFYHYDIDLNVISKSHYNNDFTTLDDLFYTGIFLKNNPNLFMGMFPIGPHLIKLMFYEINTHIYKYITFEVTQLDISENSFQCIEYQMNILLCGYYTISTFHIVMYDITGYEYYYGKHVNFPITFYKQFELPIECNGVYLYRFVFLAKYAMNIFMITNNGKMYYTLYDMANDIVEDFHDLGQCHRGYFDFGYFTDYDFYLYFPGASSLGMGHRQGFKSSHLTNVYNREKTVLRHRRGVSKIVAYQFTEYSTYVLNNDGNSTVSNYFIYPVCYNSVHYATIGQQTRFKIPTGFSSIQPGSRLTMEVIATPTYGIIYDESLPDLILTQFMHPPYYNAFHFIYTPPSSYDEIDFNTQYETKLRFFLVDDNKSYSAACYVDLILCYFTCKECSSSGVHTEQNCISCNDGYFLLENTSNCISSEMKPVNYYLNPDTQTYTKCNRACESCDEYGDVHNTKCTACAEGYEEDDVIEGHCIKTECSVDTSWYIDYTTGEYLCTEKLRECPFHYIYYNENTRECIVNCLLINKVYYNYECIDSCETINMLSYEDTCVHECPLYTVKDDNDLLTCINCKNKGMFLLNNECVAVKPENTYLINEDFNVVQSCFTYKSNTVIETLYDIELSCLNPCPHNGTYIYNSIANTCTLDIQKPVCNAYWYVDSITNAIQCVNNCNGFKYIDNVSHECLNTCNDEQYIYNKIYCVNECPEEYTKIYKGQCFLPDANIIEMETDIATILNEIDNDISNIIPDISSLQPNTFSHDNLTIQLYDTKDNNKIFEDALISNISTIDFNECETKIRNEYNMNENESIYILKFDTNSTNDLSTSINVYDNTGKEIDIESICEDEPIIISKPIHLNKRVMEMSMNGVDVFNPNDPYFNDICHREQLEDGKDMTLNERRKEVFQNGNVYCDDGCVFKEMNYTTQRAICKCDTTSIKDNNKKDESDNGSGNEDVDEMVEMFQTIKSGTIHVVKCYKLVFHKDVVVDNIGFWLYALFVTVEIMLIVLGIWFGYTKFYAHLHKFDTYYKDKKNETHKEDKKGVEEKDNDKQSKGSEVKAAPPRKHKTQNNINKNNNNSNSSVKNNNNSNNKSNSKDSCVIYKTPTKTNDRLNSNNISHFNINNEYGFSNCDTNAISSYNHSQSKSMVRNSNSNNNTKATSYSNLSDNNSSASPSPAIKAIQLRKNFFDTNKNEIQITEASVNENKDDNSNNKNSNLKRNIADIIEEETVTNEDVSVTSPSKTRAKFIHKSSLFIINESTITPNNINNNTNNITMNNTHLFPSQRSQYSDECGKLTTTLTTTMHPSTNINTTLTKIVPFTNNTKAQDTAKASTNKVESNKKEQQVQSKSSTNNNNKDSNNDNEDDDEDYDDMEFEEAMLSDNRSFCKIYFSFISNKQILLSMCLNKNPYIPLLIKLFIGVFTISLFFTFNALLFKEEYISNRYYSDTKSNDIIYLIKNEFSKCVYASLITTAMNFVMSFFFSHYLLYKTIKEHGGKENNEYIIEIRKTIKQTKRKYFIILIILLLILIFCWYYISAFCIVYNYSQIAWLEGSIITLLFNNAISFVFLLISCILRYLSNRMKCMLLFKLSGIVMNLT